MIRDILLPELGESIKSADVVKLLVATGEHIGKDQPLMELETDKASFEVPSPLAGTITEILVKEGGKAVVGDAVFKIEVEAASEISPAEPAQNSPPDETVKAVPSVEAPERSATAPLPQPVGSGSGETTYPSESNSPFGDGIVRSETPFIYGAPTRPQVQPAAEKKLIHVAAAPSVRVFARELGIDITEVTGTGPAGRISLKDVKDYAKTMIHQASSPANNLRSLPDFSRWGDTERTTMSTVRRRTAEQMEVAWQIPTVTQHDKADVTMLEELRRQYALRPEHAQSKLSMTALAAKAVVVALRKFPQFNASIDMAKNEIVYKKYIHIGIAVDTDRGLIVPVVRHADAKSVIDLSREIGELAEKARNKKIMPDDLQGGNFTITNLGGIGGTSFTPIINAPEVAILGMSRSGQEAVYIDGRFQPRLLLPLSLSYDHRLIDGADAARFLRFVIELLEQPVTLLVG